MASANWLEPAGALGNSVVRRGVTKAATPPAGGGSFVFGFNLVADDQPGVAALRNAAIDFNPMSKGGSIMAAMMRAPSFVDGGFAPFVFLGLETDDVSSRAYLLGLGDGTPSHIILRKGILSEGLPDVAPGGSGVLRRSSGTIAVGAWTYLRLDGQLQGNGDMLLTVRICDFSSTPIGTPPVWTAIPGMAAVTDLAVDALVGGFAGFAFRAESDQRKAAFFDQVELYRQV